MRSIGVHIWFVVAVSLLVPGILCAQVEEAGDAAPRAHTSEVWVPCSEFEQVHSNCLVRSGTLAARRLLEHLDSGE